MGGLQTKRKDGSHGDEMVPICIDDGTSFGAFEREKGMATAEGKSISELRIRLSREALRWS